MPRTIFRALVVAAMLSLMLSECLFAGEWSGSRRPLLAVGADGTLFGGYQRGGETGDEFTLFSCRSKQGGDNPVRSLGSYNGRLAGLAVDGQGRLLALTGDGSLSVYGDDIETLALPDARWHMLALACLDDGPVALTREDGGWLRLVRPDGRNSWKEDGGVIAVDAQAVNATLLPIGGELHLLWSSRSRDLSTGALRHAVRKDEEWRELSPLPLGEVGTFGVFPIKDGLALLALTGDPIGRAGPSLVCRVWMGDEWSSGSASGNVQSGDLLAARAFSGVASASGETWWLIDSYGRVLLASASFALRDGAPALTQETAAEVEGYGSGVSEWTMLASLGMLLAFVALLLIYCRRSRFLSRLLPGRPADLTSRAAALAVDWLLVSVAMTGYHIAAGDVRIYVELMTFGEVNRMFWINLGALALYAAVLEGLYGRTPGKRLAGIRVRSVLGGPPTFVQALFRNLMRVVDMFPVVFPGLLGALAAMFNVRRQRVGDMLAATVVRRHTSLRQRKFILASASPRRLELLSALGYDIRVEAADIDEDAFVGETPEETVRRLSEAKAKAVADKVTLAAEVVVAADTMVVLDGETLGKPSDPKDAVRMLTLLSGRSHRVLTSVTVWDTATGQAQTDVEETEVEFRELSDLEIEAYVATGDPMDKAGAYGVQSAFLVRQVRGSLSNVAGLPMEMLGGMLSSLDS